VLVLSSVAFLGVVTFLGCLELSTDDWQFSVRISALRDSYNQLVPEHSRGCFGQRPARSNS
jgi:hypothetical protein